MRTLKGLLLAAVALLLSGCGYNTIQTQDEQTKSAWSEVINQYQRRADLIPNLVATVKGFAAQEQAFGDIDLASIGGRVVDPSGAVVRGAEVTARHVDTNVTAKAATDAEGRFRFPYAANVYVSRINDYYWWENHRPLPTWYAFWEVNTSLIRPPSEPAR